MFNLGNVFSEDNCSDTISWCKLSTLQLQAPVSLLASQQAYVLKNQNIRQTVIVIIIAVHSHCYSGTHTV